MRMKVKPEVITPRISTPITVPVMRPRPPAVEVPPITTAAIASSSYITPMPDWPEVARAAGAVPGDGGRGGDGAGDAAEHARDHVDPDQVVPDVDARDDGRLAVGADRVGEFAKAR